MSNGTERRELRDESEGSATYTYRREDDNDEPDG